MFNNNALNPCFLAYYATINMLSIKILVENTSVSDAFKGHHGLSIYIENGIQCLLLDVGMNNKFLQNAEVFHVDISKIDNLILSHSHVDHTGGLDAFCEVNKQAKIYLFDRTDQKYYARILGVFNYPVGLKCSEQTRQRIQSIHEKVQIDDKTFFVKCTVKNHPQPNMNKTLFTEMNGRKIPDIFSHEGILVIENNHELVIFNSCSHSGVINSIETVRRSFEGKKIRAYVGGFHFCDPISRKHESDENLQQFVNYFNNEKIQLYTGHCTGDYSFNFLKEKLGNKIQRISTGMQLMI